MPRLKIPRFKTFGERFQARAHWTPGCWLWIGSRFGNGYGEMTLGSRGRIKVVLAHRLSYEIHNGPIPDGLFVCHKCDNPPCVNPDHLFLGTHTDNMQDRLKKGGYETMPAGEAHCNAKLTADQIREIRRRYILGHGPHYGNSPQLAAEFGVATSYIWEIVNLKVWKNL